MLSTAFSAAGQTTKFSNAAHSVTMPLDIDNNIIRMKVRINGSRELTMIFDTGASMTGIDEHFVKELGLTLGEEKLNGKGIGGTFTGGYVRSSILSAGGVSIDNQPLAIFKIASPPGFDFDGIIGYDFISAFVVEIDYQKKALTLNDPKTYVYRGKGNVVPLDLKGRKTPLVASIFNIRGHSPVAARIELDSGFDGAFQLNSPLVKKQDLLRLFQTSKDQISHGAAGEDRNMIVTIPSVRFGRIKITKPFAALSLADKGAGASTDSEGLIGGEVLRRFKVIIDYSRSRMILERNNAFSDPFEIDDSE